MCGDSAKAEDVEKLMGGKKGRMIFTDPPYNVDYKSPGGLDYDSKKYGGSGGKIFNDKKTDKECLEFYIDILKNLFDYTTDDVTIYWWFANKNNWINREAFELGGWHMSQIIIWLKNSMVFSRGQDYHRQYEPCMVGWKKKKSHFKNKKINNLKDVFHLDYDDFSELMDVWYERRDVTQNYLHPTQKPLRLPERALKKNSERGDIVIDLFGGSGSTLMACEQMERKCYSMELDPKYVDVIIKRWEEHTSKKTKKL
jgi:site-specific DNA-methyltransferase (adenine-specific)